MADQPLDPKTLKEIQRLLKGINEEMTDYRDIIRDNETFFGMMLDSRVKANKAELETLKINLAAAKALKREGESLNEAQEELIKNGDKRLIQLTNEVEKQQQMSVAAKKTAAEMMKLTEVYGRHEIVTVDLMARVFKLGGNLMNVKAAAGIAIGAIGGLANTMIKLAFDVDESSSALTKNLGINREMADAVFANTQEMARLGVTVEDQQKSFESLFKTYTGFSSANVSLRTELTATAATLEKLGVSNRDFSVGIENTTKFFSQTGEAAAATARDLADFGTIIGRTPQQIASDFAGIGESIAKLGSDGPRAFKDLAIASKVTGIEINKLMQITDKFDTFEGAATQAGKLNAALGGNFVNAMDLMMATDPAERFEMIRDSILDTGLSFDDMSYFQRKFFTEAAGLDNVGDLAKLMSGNFEDLAGATQMSSDDFAKLAERTKANQSIQEELKATLAALVPVLQPVIVSLRELAQELTEDDEFMSNLKYTIGLIGDVVIFFIENLKVLTLTLGGLGLVRAARGFMALKGGISGALGAVTNLKTTVGKGGFLKSLSSFFFGGAANAAAPEAAARGFQAQADAAGALADVGEDAAGAIEAMGEASGDAAQNLARMVGPILAIGASVAMAAFGVSFLVKAFGELTGEQIVGAIAGIAALGGTLALFAKVAFAAAAPTGAVAIGILAIGAAVGIAAFGMSYLVESFKGMADQSANILATSVALGALTASVLVLGKFGALAGPGFAIVTLGLLGIGTAISGMDAEPLGKLTSSLAEMMDNTAGLRLVRAEIEAIASAMEKVPTGASLAFAQTAAVAGDFRATGAAESNVTFQPEMNVNLVVEGEQFRTYIKNVVGTEISQAMRKRK
jgi:hypothetical protein